MRLKWVPLAGAVLALSGWMVTTALEAQSGGNDPNIVMKDNCSTADEAYNPFGGCPEDAPFPGSNSYKGDVSAAEFFSLLSTTLGPAGNIIGHPSWRNEPSYISVREGQTVHVTNAGGRAHTFTKVEAFGGGFVGGLNGTLETAPECSNPGELTFVPYGGSQTLPALESGLHTFQCCIHPWMRAAVRVN